MIFVVGSGRCGTRNIAEQYAAHGADAHHESSIHVTVECAVLLSAGIITVDQAAETLEWLNRFGDVEADYKISELIEPVLRVWPDASFLWLYRHPHRTVASMVGKDWFSDRDEDYLPLNTYRLKWELEGDNRSQFAVDVAWRAWRTTAPLVGEMTLREWRGLGQVGRCAWWWRWINGRLAEWHSRLDGQMRRLAIEDVDDVAPTNTGHPATLTAEDIELIDALTGDLTDVLYHR